MTTVRSARRRLADLGSHHHLVRGAALLAANAGLQAFFGFFFGVICTHVFSSGDVGRAMTLLSAVSVLAYVSDLGLNNTLMRVLPTSTDADAEINSAMVVTVVFSLVLAFAYIEVATRISQPLAFMASSPVRILAFMAITAAASANLLTDAVFVARRRADLSVVTDSFVQGSIRVAAPLALAGAGALGMFIASGLGAVVAVIASLVLLAVRLHVRLGLRIKVAALRRSVAFSLANYVGNVLQVLPNVVLPVIIINRLGASSAAFFAVAYNLAQLVYTVCFSLGSSLLVEGSQQASDVAALGRQAVRILIPANIVLILGSVIAGRWVLALYGTHYRSHGIDVFLVLVAGLPVISLNNVLLIIVRLRGRLRLLIAACLGSGGITIALAVVLAPRGTVWVGVAFVAGQLASALLALAAGVGRRSAEPGWREDPLSGQGWQRFWDGARWTGQVRAPGAELWEDGGARRALEPLV